MTDTTQHRLQELTSPFRGGWQRFLADVCRELDVPFRTNGYRNW